MDLFSQPGRDDGRDLFSPSEIQHLLVMLNHLAERFSTVQMRQIMAAVLRNEGLHGQFVLAAATREVIFRPRDGADVRMARHGKPRHDRRRIAQRPRRIVVPFAFDCPEPSVN